ncbi:hypothetical protein J7K28_00320 [Candidatus Aerophobetes bacterium]|nr:hypothetical protein [Candidatus Aerophobetes bacterium]
MSNRYITREEAEKLVNLGREEIGKIEKIVLLINELIFREVERVGMTNGEGKREIMIVNVLETLDECRFTFEGLSLKKEIAPYIIEMIPLMRR